MLKFIFTIAVLAGLAIQESSGNGECSATGDPHYKTFDGRTIHFQGKCQYVLAKDVENHFTVLGRNKWCGNTVTCMREITVKVKNLYIVIKHGGIVTVFGRVKTLPYRNRGVQIKLIGTKVYVLTDIGLEVRYDRVYDVYVIVNDKYYGKTRGICGNFNGKPNDLLMSNNVITNNDQDFANSWKVHRDRSCTDPGITVNPCLKSNAEAKEAKHKCALLTNSPFSACKSHVNVESGFVEDCEYDVCACTKHPLTCLCEEYDAYATSCDVAGVSIQWKHLPQFRKCGNMIGKK